ncbi:MAG TPA: segregation/condensation protein A [Candidatus Krumholzibacteria bacterium]|nr:segregation/condensation protein A [Candidatus Krumholzibacteria bacterium]
MILPRSGESAAALNGDEPQNHWEGQRDSSGPSGSGYNIQLDRFEGPLDLLLYLIQRDEIDIYDIPIAHITEQYLASIEDLDSLDLENAGEFLVMAATLMRIKARLLLPVQRTEEEEEGADPRDELVRRLLEYKKYKEAAQNFAEAEEQRRQYFSRPIEYPFRDQIPQEPPEFSLSLFDLLGSVKEILDTLKGDQLHHVYNMVYTVEEQAEKLQAMLEGSQGIRFKEVFGHASCKMEVVVTFVAMLELIRQGQLWARQVEAYGEIWIYPQDVDKKSVSGKKKRGGEKAAKEVQKVGHAT